MVHPLFKNPYYKNIPCFKITSEFFLLPFIIFLRMKQKASLELLNADTIEEFIDIDTHTQKKLI